MRYVVVGAGAIGGGVGGLLTLAGVDTTLVARGDHLAALRADGLRLDVGGETQVVDVRAAGAPADVAWTDDTVVLLAVKSQQTLPALADLLPAMPADTPVVSLQNGVANERTLLRHVEHVHAVCVMMPATHLEPGRVEVHSCHVPGLLDIGRYPHGVDDTTRAVAADLERAGFRSLARPDVMAWKHRKLLMNLGNGVDAVCGDDNAATELVDRCRAEGELVLEAAGIPVTPEAEDLERRDDLLRPLAGSRGGGSTWQSVRRATGNVEVDYLNGEIVLLGRLHGVPAPANELVRATVVDLARRGGAVASIDAADLLARLDAVDPPADHG